jgi:hypothetical protein
LVRSSCSRSTDDLGGCFFLAQRINRESEETTQHVISFAMLAVHDGAELFASYAEAVDAMVRRPDRKDRPPSLN